MHLVAAAADHVAVEAHQELHLVGGARPVLGREGVRRDRLHADLDRALDHVEERVLALLVAGGAGEPALLGPAAVAVHHDRDVPRDQLRRDLRRPGAGRVRRRRAHGSLHACRIRVPRPVEGPGSRRGDSPTFRYAACHPEPRMDSMWGRHFMRADRVRVHATEVGRRLLFADDPDPRVLQGRLLRACWASTTCCARSTAPRSRLALLAGARLRARAGPDRRHVRRPVAPAAPRRRRDHPRARHRWRSSLARLDDRGQRRRRR